jgi:hypothetical protein
MAELIPFKPDAKTHADAETELKKRLFAWADGVLQQLGLAAKVAQAVHLNDLRKIILDTDDIIVELAIRSALHPASGEREKHFNGLRAGALKRLLKARFTEIKKNREAELLRGSGQQSSQQSTAWTDDIKFDDKGNVRPILANLILFLREHQDWKGVLAFDQFNTRVVIKKHPYWSEEEIDTLWTDHFESLVRVWFQNEDIAAGQGDIGRAVQAAARHNPTHPVRDYLDSLTWDGRARIDTWLVDYLHADDSPYIRAIGPRYLISAVARIYKPGCKVDHMIVLEGPQGKQKSEALRALAVRDAWFTDRLSHVLSKDAAARARWRLDHRMGGNGRAVSRDSGLGEIIHHATPRSVSTAVRQAHDQLAAFVRIRRHHQPDCRGLPERSDRSSANLAGGVQGHDRYCGACL